MIMEYRAFSDSPPRPGGLRPVPHRARRGLLHEGQARRRAPALRGDVQQLPPAHPQPGGEPAPRQGDLRGLPLAAEVPRQPDPGAHPLRRRRGQHPGHHRAHAQDRRPHRREEHRHPRPPHRHHRAHQPTSPPTESATRSPRSPTGTTRATWWSTSPPTPRSSPSSWASSPSGRWTAWTATTGPPTPSRAPAGPWTRRIVNGVISRDLPFIHKKGVEVLKAEYKTQDEGAAQIAKAIDRLLPDQLPRRSTRTSAPWWTPRPRRSRRPTSATSTPR